MGLQTKKDFAEMCGLSTKNLATYIGRSKVKVDNNDLINDKDPINKSFLELRKHKLSEKQLIDHITNYPPAATSLENPDTQHTEALNELLKDDNREIVNGKIVFKTSLDKLAHFKAEKTERETERLDLDIAKKRGQIIPSDMVKPIFLQHNQFIMTQFKNAADDIVRLFAKQRELTTEEVSEIKGELVEVINRSVRDATAMSLSAIGDIINEFKVKKGVGERTS